MGDAETRRGETLRRRLPRRAFTHSPIRPFASNLPASPRLSSHLPLISTVLRTQYSVV